ncbi:MAG: hypothetical protein J6K45_03085 [Clostridia bacterium]|nr:hypothetical protein [Clostridia bacterium]
MKNKKIIIIFILIVIIVAFLTGVYIVKNSYMYEDEEITDGKKDLINHLESIEDTDEKEKQVKFSVEQNIITKEEANKILGK